MELVFKVLLLAIPVFSEARVVSSRRHARLTLAEPSPSYYYTNIDGYPGTYAFGYDVQDGYTGNTQFRHEERFPNGTVMGNYGYVDAYGKPHRYRYVADKMGYRVMNDLPNKPAVAYPTPQQPSMESSVTWTRPKKKKEPSKNYLTKIPINKGNLLIQSNNLLPPSAYVSDY